MKAKTAECIRKAINISSQKDFFKFDKSSFNANKIKEALPITSPKLMELINNINELDKNDFDKYGTYFKHIIYSDVKTSIAGIKLVASALTAFGMSNIYNSSLTIKIPESNNNFALLSSLPVYDKPTFPIKLKKSILSIFNDRPSNIYGKNIRFLLIDSGYKEGIDVYDVKYIHLVDDLISKSDETQAIGRGTRYCGQKGLNFHPELGWPLHVFKYKLIIDENKYGYRDAFELYIKESNIDINKLKFSADLENICRFGAVDYEINKPIHEFGYEKEDNLKSKEIFNYYEKFKDFKLIDPYLSLEKNNNNDFKLVKQAYLNFGGVIQKKTKKFIDIKKIKSINLNYKMDFLTMRLFIRKNFNYLKWTNIELKNDCINKQSDIKNENRIITLGNSQEFVSKFFTSSSLYKGILFWHSVGTGKTCSAIATASNSFEKDNYTIIWVTRHSLKSEIFKNIFQSVCSNTIKEKLEKGIYIPEDPDGIASKLKYLNNRWIEPISYKQFTNLISKKNEYYTEMVKRNGTEDPFKKTLIIIDEAHKLYDDETPANERPDINALKKAIYNSYKISGRESCKLILMSATPYTTDPMQLFKLLNLLREDDYFPENFEDFKKEFLDLETYKFNKSKEFLDKITGYISYLNREKDVRQFAYPVIYIKEVNSNSYLNLNKSYDIINDYVEDIKDYLNNNNNLEKSKELVKNLKDLTKKTKKTDELISSEEAIDLCFSKTKKIKEKENEDENTIKFNELIKNFNDIIKYKEKDLKKKNKN